MPGIIPATLKASAPSTTPEMKASAFLEECEEDPTLMRDRYWLASLKTLKCFTAEMFCIPLEPAFNTIIRVKKNTSQVAQRSYLDRRQRGMTRSWEYTALGARHPRECLRALRRLSCRSPSEPPAAVGALAASSTWSGLLFDILLYHVRICNNTKRDQYLDCK